MPGECRDQTEPPYADLVQDQQEQKDAEDFAAIAFGELGAAPQAGQRAQTFKHAGGHRRRPHDQKHAPRHDQQQKADGAAKGHENRDSENVEEPREPLAQGLTEFEWPSAQLLEGTV